MQKGKKLRAEDISTRLEIDLQKALQQLTQLHAEISVLSNDFKKFESASDSETKTFLDNINKELTAIKNLRAESNKLAQDRYNDAKKNQLDSNRYKGIRMLEGAGSNFISDITSKVKTLSNVITGVLGINLGRTMSNAINLGNEVTENANLMAVSFGAITDEYGNIDKEASTYYTDALALQDKMHEKMQIGIADLSKAQATYNYMFKNQGIDASLSSRLSGNLTKMAQDMASLYNTTFDEQVKKIESGLVGQTKSLRVQGIDLSVDSMQQTLNNLGIDATASQLSYANKELLRYITLFEQASMAQGDFARTSNTSANQIKMLQDQLTQLGAMVGQVLNSSLGQVVSYVRAIIYVLQDLVKTIGNMLGVDWGSTGMQSATYDAEALGDAYDDVSSSIGGASSKAKEFKKQIMGFDVIHNITPPSTSGGGGGGGLSSPDISDALISKLKDWNNNMEAITDKAREYADNILKALGFTKDINGNLKWNWNNMSKLAKLITGTILAAGIIKIVTKVVTLIGHIKNIMTLLNGANVTQTALQSGIQIIGTTLSTMKKNLLDILSTVTIGIKTGLTGTSEWLVAFGKLLGVIGGVVLAINGIVGVVSDINKVLNGTVDVADMLPAIIARITEAISGVIVVVGILTGHPIVALIAGLAGVISLIIAKVNENNASMKETDAELRAINDKTEELHEKNQQNLDDIAEMKKATAEIINGIDSEYNHYQQLAAELDTIIDKNGEIKEGYEERAKVIINELNSALGLNLSIVDGHIRGYEELGEAIDKIIQKKKVEAYLEAYREDYQEAIKKEKDLTNQLTEATNNYNAAQEKVSKANLSTQHDKIKAELERLGIAFSNTGDEVSDFEKDLDELEFAYIAINGAVEAGVPTLVQSHMQWATESEALAELKAILDEGTAAYDANKGAIDSAKGALGELNTARSAYMENDKLQILYNDLLVASESGKEESIVEAEKRLSAFYSSETGKQNESIMSQVEVYKASKENIIKVREEQGKELTAADKLTYETMLKSLSKELTEETKTVKKLTPEQIEAWKFLATESADIYNEKIGELDGNTQLLLNTLTNNVDRTSPQFIEAWSQMAFDSKEDFANKLSSLPEDQRILILEAVSQVTGTESAVVEAYSQLSDEGKKKYLDGIKSLPDDQKEKIVQMMNSIKDQQGTAGEVAKSLSKTIKDSIESTNIQVNRNNIQVDGNSITEKIQSSIGTVTVTIKGDYKKTWHSTPNANGDYYYAQGGTPTKGQVFVAREAGAELVGNIGNQTTVMNNIQIIAAVSKGVASAVSKVLTGGFKIQMPSIVNLNNNFSPIDSLDNEATAKTIANTIIDALRKNPLRANITAKTDKTVIVKEAIDGINQATMQTGEFPLITPI